MRFIKPVSRSVYKVRYPVKGSFNLGEICPVGAPIEVIPGDGFKLDVYSVIRMATPIAPIMDDIDAELTAMFVPLRLVSNKNIGDWTSPYAQAQAANVSFEKIIGNGVGNPSDWTQTNIEAYAAPTEGWNPQQARGAGYTTIGEALGLGLGINGTSTWNVLGYQLYGYNLIYQEHFRNQNVEASRTLDKTSNVYGASGDDTDQTDDGSFNAYAYNQALSVAYKHGDLMTNCVPNPEKGPSIKLPLGEEALINTGTYHTLSGPVILNSSSFTATPGTIYGLDLKTGSTGNGFLNLNETGPAGTQHEIDKTNLVADLRNASAASVNNFIEAWNIQQLLLKDIGGSRYYEQLMNHFSIQNEDIRLYRPEILSVNRFQINISTVVQQSGADTSTSSTDQGNYLGTTGGYSMTAHKDHAVSQEFGEYGLIYLLMCCRQKHTYGQGLPKQYMRSTRFDWFFPELGRLGWDSVSKKELNIDETSTTPFGYRPMWQELRDVNQGQAFGFLNPTKSNSLDYWTLTDSFNSTPTLSISFLKENRDNISRALAIGSTGPDFIMDALVVGTKATLVPVSNTPKLFD